MSHSSGSPVILGSPGVKIFFQLEELRSTTATSATLAAPASSGSGMIVGTLESTYEVALFHQFFSRSPNGCWGSAARQRAGRARSSERRMAGAYIIYYN